MAVLFFDVDLLCSAQGKYYISWTAGTRGITCISYQPAKKGELLVTCENLIKVINKKPNGFHHSYLLRLSSEIFATLTAIKYRHLKLFRTDTMHVCLRTSGCKELTPETLKWLPFKLPSIRQLHREGLELPKDAEESEAMDLDGPSTSGGAAGPSKNARPCDEDASVSNAKRMKTSNPEGHSGDGNNLEIDENGRVKETNSPISDIAPNTIHSVFDDMYTHQSVCIVYPMPRQEVVVVPDGVPDANSDSD